MALGDVSGKGTGAALLMTVLRAAVRGHWAEAIGRRRRWRRINRTVCQNVTAGKYITFFLARLDPASRTRAATSTPATTRRSWSARDGTVETLDEGGMVLGLFDSMPYEEGVAELRPGDTLLIFSDGVTETWSRDGRGVRRGAPGRAGRARTRPRRRRRSRPRSCASWSVFAAGHEGRRDDRTLIVLKRY